MNYQSFSHPTHNTNRQWCPTRFDFLYEMPAIIIILHFALLMMPVISLSYLSEHNKLPAPLVSAKALYTACFKHQVPQSIKEIAQICDIREQDLSSIFEGVCELLPSDLVERICQQLDISLKLSQEIKN